jgi:hypothetical protein
MAIDFPASPTNGQTFTSGSVTYTYDGTKWTAVAAGGGGGGATPTKIEVGNTKAEVTDTGADGAFVVTTEGVARFRVAPTGTVGLPGGRLAFGGLWDNPGSHYIEYRSSIDGLWLNGSKGVSIEAGGGEQIRIGGGRIDVLGATLAAGYVPQVASNVGTLNLGATSPTGTAIMISSFNDYKAVSFIRDAAAIGYERGSITVNNSSTAYNTSSDYRLKENVVPLTGAADRLKQLPVRRFNFIADPGKTVDGFIAHEAQAVVPECVTGTKDEVDADGNAIYQGIDQSKLVPLLTAALQEAIGRIETLEAKVAALESA